MDSSKKIDSMEALLFALSLEVALMQMRILEGCTELRLRQWPIKTKHHKQQYEKLKRDRAMMKDIIKRTLIELVEAGEWQSLEEAARVLQHEEDRPVTKRREFEELQAQKAAIVEELDTKRLQWVEEIRCAALKIAILRDKIKDDQANANARISYVEKWILARAESLELQYDQPRPPMPRLDHEQRVHDELQKAYNMQIEERKESLKYWEKRYEVDIKDISARVAAKTEQLRVASARHEDLQRLFDLHQGEIRGWLTFKKERVARLAREAHLRLSATRIQAWWRGVMVRRALGQFRYLRNMKKPGSKNKKK